jgi:hypothetical protein
MMSYERFTLVKRSCGFLLLLAATACGDSGNKLLPPPMPTSPSPPASTGPDPVPPRQPMTFEMTGVVADDEGAPVPGARMEVWFDYVDLASVITDESGHYKVNFVGVPGQNHLPPRDPVGTETAVAFAQVEAPGYEFYARYILGSTQYLVEDVRLHRVTRITAGESAVLTIAPADTVCVLDV